MDSTSDKDYSCRSLPVVVSVPNPAAKTAPRGFSERYHRSRKGFGAGGAAGPLGPLGLRRPRGRPRTAMRKSPSSTTCSMEDDAVERAIGILSAHVKALERPDDRLKALAQKLWALEEKARKELLSSFHTGEMVMFTVGDREITGEVLKSKRVRVSVQQTTPVSRVWSVLPKDLRRPPPPDLAIASDSGEVPHMPNEQEARQEADL